MRGHLQCRDTLAGNEGCPLKTGTTVVSLSMSKSYSVSCSKEIVLGLQQIAAQ